MTLTTVRPRWYTDRALQAVVEAATVMLSSAGHAGTVVEVAAPSFAGRNGSWVLTLDSAERVFVKKIAVDKAGEQAFARSVCFAQFARDNPGQAPVGPRLLAHDADTALLIFEHCPGVSMAQLLIDEAIPEHFSADVGRMLATLHAAPTTNLTRINPPSPPVAMMANGISQERYVQMTLAELSFWAAIQQDTELVAATTRLRTEEQANLRAPVHGDLRLDQFHLRAGTVQLLDWEEFGIGDPARDLGTLAGEWIYRAVLDTVTSRGGAGAPPLRFDTASATARITERMQAFAPHIQTMWSAYRQHQPQSDPELARRATAHLGWHLIDRTLARATLVAQLPGIERAAAGIGRKILLAPQNYAPALGFKEAAP